MKVGNFLRNTVDKVGSFINRANPIIQKVGNVVKTGADFVRGDIAPLVKMIPGIGNVIGMALDKGGKLVGDVTGGVQNISQRVADSYGKIQQPLSQAIDTGQQLTQGVREAILETKQGIKNQRRQPMNNVVRQ